MNDELLNIKLTESEVNTIMTALEGWIENKDVNTSEECRDLVHDLMEQVARHDDDWDVGLEGRSFIVAEDDMIQRGMDAREEARMHSHAAMRRKARQFGEFEVANSLELSAAQRHDVFEITTEEELQQDDPTQVSRSLCGNDPIAW